MDLMNLSMIFSSVAHIGEMSQVNQFGDGFCAASISDIADGMNRNFGIRTLSEGGGLIGVDSKDRYAIGRIAIRCSIWDT